MSHLRRGDVFYADLGHKRRPYLVVQNNIGNRHSPRVIVVSITSQIKKPYPTVCIISYGNIARSAIHCEEIFTIDIPDDIEIYEHLPRRLMHRVDKCLAVSLGLGGEM